MKGWDYSKALQSHQRALEIRREGLGDNHPKTTKSYSDIGNIQYRLRDYPSTLYSHQSALKI